MKYCGNFDEARIFAVGAQAMADLPAEDRQDRIDRIIRGDVEGGISMERVGTVVVFWWAGRELTKCHLVDLMRRDTSMAN